MIKSHDYREGRHLGGGFGGFDPCGGYGGGFGGGHGSGYGGHGGNSQQVLYSLQYLALQLVEYVQALQTGGNYGGFGGNYGGFGGNHGGFGGFGGLGGLWRSGRNSSEFGREGGEQENIVQDVKNGVQENEGNVWRGAKSLNNP